MTLYRLTRGTGSELLQLPEAMEAAAWTDALSEVLEQLGAGGIDDVVCHLQPGGGFRLGAAGARTLVELTPTQGLAELPSIDITGALAPSSPAGADQLPEPSLSRDAQGIGAAALDRLRLRLADLPPQGMDGRAAAALDHLLAVVPAESGSILVHQPAIRQLRFAAARGPGRPACWASGCPKARASPGSCCAAGAASMCGTPEARRCTMPGSTNGPATRPEICSPCPFCAAAWCWVWWSCSTPLARRASPAGTARPPGSPQQHSRTRPRPEPSLSPCPRP